jgi:hypothetical protein
MTKIASDLLNDTLSLVQLARETALQRGNQAQAERLAPVADNLRSLVHTARRPGGEPASAVSTAKVASAPAGAASADAARPNPTAGVMGQSDFQTLLQTVQAAQPLRSAPAAGVSDRNQVVQSMASAGMADAEIARQMGMTRDEVRLIQRLSAPRPAGLTRDVTG